MKLFVLFALVVAANARAKPGSCQMSEWEDWSEWNYPNHSKCCQSFPAPDKDHAKVSSMRENIMTLRQEQTDLFHKCMTEGTCPQFDNHQVDGFVACDNTLNLAVTPTASYPCMNVDHLAFVPTAELFPDPTIGGTKQTNDIWGWVDTADNNQEYAIVGMNDGTSFVRVTPNSKNLAQVDPVVLGHLVTASGVATGTWRDIKVIGDHAFIVSEHSGHGMQVFDLTRLRDLDGNPPQRFDSDAFYGDTGNTHNIVGSAQGFVYLVGSTSSAFPNNCQGGLHAIDVSDPTNPTFAGCFGGDGYVHDAQCFVYNGPDTTYQGREICMCYNEDTFTIVDVEDKANMQLISRTGYGGAEYTHQGWITDDHTVVLLDDELDEQSSTGEQRTYIWDVIDLDNPVLQNTFMSGLQSIDHNQYIIGDLTYQSNYRTGLRILRINQAAFTITEEAYFDVYPDSDGAVFNGAWSSYPYFPSGNIVTTSSEYGVYVLQPSVTPNSGQVKKQATQERKRLRHVLQADDLSLCPALEEVETCCN